MNERKMIIHRDLILRFEEFCLPYIFTIESGRQDIEWPIKAVERKLWWTSAADSCLLYTSPSPRDLSTSRMPSSA